LTKRRKAADEQKDHIVAVAGTSQLKNAAVLLAHANFLLGFLGVSKVLCAGIKWKET
jgi:hypothetical protein